MDGWVDEWMDGHVTGEVGLLIVSWLFLSRCCFCTHAHLHTTHQVGGGARQVRGPNGVATVLGRETVLQAAREAAKPDEDDGAGEKEWVRV
jgi:hypothetical protein